MLRRIALLISLAILFASLAAQYINPYWLESRRDTVFDLYQQLAPRVPGQKPVVVIDIDDGSLERVGQWPWSRLVLAELVRAVANSGATALAFDILFSEPDRASPRAVLTPYATEDLRAHVLTLMSRLPDSDQAFIDSLSALPVVTAFSLLAENDDRRRPASKSTVVAKGVDVIRYAVPFGGAVASMAALEAVAAGNGSITPGATRDGIIRQVPVLMRLGQNMYASLWAELIRVSRRKRTYIAYGQNPELDQGTGIVRVQLARGRIVDTDENGLLWLHYRRHDATDYIPAWQILIGDEIAKARLKDKLVIVGTSAQGLRDLRFNTLGEYIPGVEMHMQAIEQTYDQSFLKRPFWARFAEMLYTLVIAVLAIFVGLRLAALWSAGIAFTLLAATLAGGYIWFRTDGLLLEPLMPTGTVLAVFVITGSARMIQGERDTKFIRGAFERYMSPRLVEYLIDNPEALNLQGEYRECSFVMTDLAGFTSFMEQSEPDEVIDVLNGYLDGMVEIAFQHDGTLDRIVGDAVAVMFSAPIEQPDHRARAIRCAMAMDRFAQDYARRMTRPDGPPFGKTRIGVHAGRVMVGNLGGEQVLDYRALGDPINTAARLESVNRYLGTRVCISEDSLSGAPDTASRPIGKLILKGKDEAVACFEPLEIEGVGRADRDAYAAAYQAMQAGESDALARFETLSADYPDDGLVAFHLGRLKDGESGDVVRFDDK